MQASTRLARSFSPIGVVDLDKLLLVHPSENESPEARANAIADIQRATASSAIVVLFAAETLDLTGEVIQRLRQ